MSEEDIPCDVCRITDFEIDNEMVFCDKCNLCVHQDCYGIKVIPKGAWFCKPCKEEVEPVCIFCLQKKGAMTLTTEGKWAHIICALWIREVSFQEPDILDTVTNVDRIPKSRWKLSCFICRQKGGACIQCYVPSCRTAYHVTCAYNNSLHMLMDDDTVGECEIKFESFCENHTKNPPKKKIAAEKLPKKRGKSSTKDTSSDPFQPHSIGASSSAMPNITLLKKNSNQENLEVENDTCPKEIEEKNCESTLDNLKAMEVGENVFESTQDNFKLMKVIKKVCKDTPNSPKEVVDDLQKDEHIMEEKRNIFNTSTSAYIGTAIIHKATARKSFAVPEKKVKNKKEQSEALSCTEKNDIRNLSTKKTQTKAKGKRKLNQSSNNSFETSSSEPTQYAKKNKTSKPKKTKKALKNEAAMQTEGGSLTASIVQAYRSATPSSVVQGTSFSPYQHSSLPTAAYQPDYSNNGLNAFLGYIGSLLGKLPEKKSLKVQRKIISWALKEHGSSSDEDVISDISSLSD